ncbi:hypothetical protein DFQ30_002896 [Apophysomyces sp. BC1015]|nr:hypothetical protein DFQ30_002896 [Apophysomyces sp. BC1015]KAG0165453.1 hypothetical protein DFQ29_001539 [Apophysomyces sp. BC1021]
MSYFNHTKIQDWNIQDALNHSGLVAVIEELKTMSVMTNETKSQAALKLLNTLEIMLTRELRQNIGNIEVVEGSVITGSNNSQTNYRHSFLEILYYKVSRNATLLIEKGVSPIPPRHSGHKDNYGNDEEPINIDDSCTSGTYHEHRTSLHFFKITEPWPLTSSMWLIGEYDVLAGLKTFYETAKYLANEKGNVNNIRILGLHRIFPFMVNQNESITKYLDHHVEIMNELAAVSSELSMPTRSVDLSLWCDSLTDGNDTFVGMKKKRFVIMENAYKKGDATDILATEIAQ